MTAPEHTQLDDLRDYLTPAREERGMTTDNTFALEYLSEGRDVTRPPSAVKAAFREGLRLHARGHAGEGLQDQTVDDARALAKGSPMSPEKAVAMRAWFARHGAQPEQTRARKDQRAALDAGEDLASAPALVSWLLWGGDEAQAWAEKVVAHYEKTEKLMDSADHRYTRVSLLLETLSSPIEEAGPVPLRKALDELLDSALSSAKELNAIRAKLKPHAREGSPHATDVMMLTTVLETAEDILHELLKVTREEFKAVK